jgi:type I restriction enzyme S subunit
MRKSWREVTLGDVVELIPGKYVPKSEYVDDGPFFIYGSNSVMGKYSKALINVPHTVMAAIGAYAGAVRYSPEPSWVNNNAFGLVANSETEPKFLFLWLENILDLKSVVAGTGQPYVQRLSLKAVRINLPSQLEQKRIVDLVSSVDSYIAALQKQADAARVARNAVLSELLSAGRDDWLETKVSALLSRSVGGVWGAEPGADQEAVTVVRSTEFTTSGVLNFATGVPRSIKSSQLSSRELAEGDILLEKSGGGPSQPVGRVVYVESDIPRRFVCSNFIQLLTPNRTSVSPRFLFLALWLWHSEDRTLEFQAQTTGIRNLRTSDYLDQIIAVPPLVEQRRIVEIVSSVDGVIRSTEQAVSDAKQLRSGLLSDLLSGDHEIPESYDRLLGAA